MTNTKQQDLFSYKEMESIFNFSYKDSGIEVVDLFSGCGGLSLGLEQANFKILAAFDNWEQAIKIYKKNFKHDALLHDLSNENSTAALINKYSPSMIVGGPPCQDFSHAGKRKEAKRANLTLSFARIIKACNPEWFIMENVDRAQNSFAYQDARNIFIKCGYGLNERVLDASLCGVPQKRKRFFCVGHKGSKHKFLDDVINRFLSNEPMTVRDYFNDELGIDYYYRHPRNYNRRGIFSLDEPSPTIRGVNRPLPAGYKGHKGDVIKLSNNIRSLSTTERARIQTFPKDFVLEGNKTNLEQMIGNAVPVKLAEFVARSILIYMRDKSKAHGEFNGIE